MPFDHLPLYKNSLVFACTNHGYMDYTKNFLHYLDKIDIPWTLVLFCMDQRSYDACKTIITKHASLDIRLFRPMNYSSNFHEWGQNEYKQLVYYRYEVMYQAFKDPKVTSAIYFDTDIVILKDPVDKILYCMDLQPEIVFFGQCDENARQCTRQVGCPNVCSGVSAFRKSEILESIMVPEKWRQTVHKYSGDQEWLNTVLDPKRKATLPTDLFIHPPKHANFNSETMTYHFNYMIGNAKKEYMKRHGYWAI